MGHRATALYSSGAAGADSPVGLVEMRHVLDLLDLSLHFTKPLGFLHTTGKLGMTTDPIRPQDNKFLLRASGREADRLCISPAQELGAEAGGC